MQTEKKKAPKKVLNMTPVTPFPNTFAGRVEKWGLPLVGVVLAVIMVWTVVKVWRQ